MTTNLEPVQTSFPPLRITDFSEDQQWISLSEDKRLSSSDTQHDSSPEEGSQSWPYLQTENFLWEFPRSLDPVSMYNEDLNSVGPATLPRYPHSVRPISTYDAVTKQPRFPYTPILSHRVHHRAPSSLAIQNDPEYLRPSKPVEQPRKTQRAAHACEPCRNRKAKCDEMQPCTRCIKKELECIYRDFTRPKQETELYNLKRRLDTIEENVNKVLQSLQEKGIMSE